MKIFKRIMIIIVVMFLLLLLLLGVWIKVIDDKRNRLVAERESVFHELRISLKQLGEENDLEICEDDSVFIVLKTPNIDDDELENILRILNSVSYTPSGFDSYPGVYLRLDGTSVTMNGINLLIRNLDALPYRGLYIGPEICFSKTSVESVYRLLEQGKNFLSTLTIHGDFDRAEMKSTFNYYWTLQSVNREEKNKEFFVLTDVHVIVGEQDIEPYQFPPETDSVHQSGRF